MVKGLPAILGLPGESRSLIITVPATTIAASDDRGIRPLVLDGLIYAVLDALHADLDAGSRLAAGHLALLGPKLDVTASSIRSYLTALVRR